MTDHDIIEDLLRREGSEYTDHPHDRGGATRYGITQRTWERYLTKQPEARRVNLPQHVMGLTEPLAREFYRHEHIRPFAWIKHDRLRALAVDCGVQHGLSRTVRWLQEVANVATDGQVGPITRAAVNTQPTRTYYRLIARRIKFYAEIATDEIDRREPQDPDAVFLRGWINRACEFLELEGRP